MRRLRGGEIEDVFLHCGRIEPPGDHPCPARNVGKIFDPRCRPGDRQMMIEPGRLRSDDETAPPRAAGPSICRTADRSGSGTVGST